jgi:hypothetical protein
VSVDNKKMYSIKFNYNGEVRRAQVSVEDGAQIISFDNVAAVARNLFMIEKPIKLQWTDDEGDTICCTTDVELAEAIRVMSSENKKAFKFDVVVLGASTSTTPSIAAEVQSPPQKALSSPPGALSGTDTGFSLAQPAAANTAAVSEPSQQQVHLGVTCDGCGMDPIVGIRFRCTVRHNYDLCATCEAQDTTGLPMIKIYNAQDTTGQPAFHGHPFHQEGHGGGRADFMRTIWEQICYGKVTNNNGFLEFEDTSLLWDGIASKLFVRQNYSELFEEITKHKVARMLLLGSPGVGKSMFVWYFIYAAAKDAISSDRAVPSIIYQLRDGVLLSFTLQQGVPVVNIIDSSRTPCDIYISDSSVPPDNCPAACRVHISGEGNRVAYKVFKNAISGSPDQIRNITRYMSPFEESEALLVGHMYRISAAAVRTRYLFFGGCMRVLMSVSTKYGIGTTDDISDDVDDAISSYFQDVVHNPDEISAARGCKVVIVDKIRGYGTEAGKSVEASSLFRHWVQDPVNPALGIKSWASDFMKWLAGILFERRRNDITSNITKMLDEVSGAKGAMFETYCHREIYRNLKAGREYMLQGLSRADTSSMGGSASVVTHRVLIRTPGCLVGLPNGSYAKPVIRNFGAVDAIVKLDNVVFILQMTVASNHPGKESTVTQMKALVSILCPNNEPHATVFVLETQNFNEFKRQKNYGDSPQYKCFADIGSAAALKINVHVAQLGKQTITLGSGAAISDQQVQRASKAARKRKTNAADFECTEEDDAPTVPKSKLNQTSRKRIHKV